MIENVANAFNLIQRLYDETATLVREIERLLGTEPESFMIGRPAGYGISTRGSTGLDQQNVNRWPTRRFAVFFVPENTLESKGGQKVTKFPTEKVVYLRFLLDGYDSFNFNGMAISEPSLLFGVLKDTVCPNGRKKKFEAVMADFEYIEAKFLKNLPNISLNEASVSTNGEMQVVPLFSLTDTEVVNSRVIQPLLAQWREVQE